MLILSVANSSVLFKDDFDFAHKILKKLNNALLS